MPSLTACTTSEDALATVLGVGQRTHLEVGRDVAGGDPVDLDRRPEVERRRTIATRLTPRERASAIETRLEVVVSEACSSRSWRTST